LIPAPLARTIMVQGTASSVGKSVLTAALCRIFRQDGLSVAPFKAQNMANNSYVTPDGGEIGRAQALQAAAAGIEPSTDMNPVLLKPEADNRAQVVVNGRSRGSLPAREYYRRKTELWDEVTAALDRLRAQHDVVVIEGAGSPAEVNLRATDIANMRVALYAQSPVLLVGDIDRGGVFASLLGTLELLEPSERSLVRGLIINRFRGDRAVLEPLPSMIAARVGVPVIGVVPYIPDLRLSDEDAASLDGRPISAAHPGPAAASERRSLRFSKGRRPGAASEAVLRAAVVRLPRISNFDDFDPLRRAGVAVDFVTEPGQLDGAHLVILPGTKSSIADLRWLKGRGLDAAVLRAAARGAGVVGICGGYQMLCERLDDPLGADSGGADSEQGLGLLRGVTVFEPEKTTRRVSFEVATATGLFEGTAPVSGHGYEIHTGRTGGASRAPIKVTATGEALPHADGAVSADGWVLGTYVHGLFDNPELLSRVLSNIARRHGVAAPEGRGFSLDQEIDRLADVVRGALDMPLIYRLLGPGPAGASGGHGQAHASPGGR
jgi:adenosylcobyric acid synthase